MVIFGCGVVTGALLMKTELPSASVVGVAPSPPASTNASPPFAQVQRQLEFFRRMQKQLDVTPGQHEEIAKIMKESQERTRTLWEQIGPQMREELRRVREEIRQVLTPEQQTKMDELLKARPRKADGTNLGAGRLLRPLFPASPAQTNGPTNGP
jgi:Spy/CpxP family protein refolding chaperone